MRKTNIDLSVLLLVTIALLLAGVVLFVTFYLRPDPINEALGGDKVINILFVIEADSRSGERSAVKPFCSYVFMYYPTTKRAAVIDVPGSLGQIIQRTSRVDRIDTVYDPRRITPFRQEIEKLLGVEISFSLIMTLENLGKITDLIEGVELFIPSPVNEYQDGYILFPSGVTVLDGDKAKVYLTYELPEENDELAVFRRQRFFMGLIKRLGEQSRFLDDPQVVRVFQSLFRTGSSQRVSVRFFEEIGQIDTDRISIQSVSGNVREVSGQTLVFPHWDGSLIKEIVRQTVRGLEQATENTLGGRVFTVEVLNGTSINGLAGRTADIFRGFGYDIIAIDNADHEDYEKTVIIDRTGYQNVARAFGDVIRCSNIQEDSPYNLAYDSPEFMDMELDIGIFENRSDITLIIGRDFNGRYVTE